MCLRIVSARAAQQMVSTVETVTAIRREVQTVSHPSNGELTVATELAAQLSAHTMSATTVTRVAGCLSDSDEDQVVGEAAGRGVAGSAPT